MEQGEVVLAAADQGRGAPGKVGVPVVPSSTFDNLRQLMTSYIARLGGQREPGLASLVSTSAGRVAIRCLFSSLPHLACTILFYIIAIIPLVPATSRR